MVLKRPTILHCVGYKHGQKDAEPVLELYRRLGFDAHVIVPPWLRWVSKRPFAPLKEVVRNMVDLSLALATPGEMFVLSGHSFGGVIAMCAANVIENIEWPQQPDLRLVVQSMSNWIGDGMDVAFANPRSDSRDMTLPPRSQARKLVLPPIYSPSLALCARQEERYTSDLWRGLKRTWTDVRLCSADCGHNITVEPKYLDLLEAELPELICRPRRHPIPMPISSRDPNPDRPYENFVLYKEEGNTRFVYTPSSEPASGDFMPSFAPVL